MKFFTGFLLSSMMMAIWIIPAKGQVQDDPNLDQVPLSLRQKRAQMVQQSDVPLGTVVTINNWDNFNLATDFGEGNIAVNPATPTWFFTAYNTNAAHRSLNGHDWVNSTPSFGASMQGDPVVAYDSLGNLFYENMYGSSILGCKVMKSTDNGATWGPSVTSISGNDKNWIACDQTSGPYANYVYTTMTNNGVGAFARSTDHGVTWENTFAPSTQSLPGMMVCVGPNGNVQGGSVYVVTNSGSSFASTYTFYKSTDGGQNFTMMSAQNFSGYVGTNVSNRNSVQGMRTRPYPFITADNSYGAHRGRLYLVYASNDPPGSGNKPDIWLRYSDNGGQTWSSATRVNDDANPSQHHQWHPATWCDKETGKLYIQWMDTRDCPTSDSALIYATYSADGGATFAPNQMISNKKMKIDCPTCGGGGTPRYQGDYNGIISNKKVSMVNWTDFRSGTFMSAVAYFPDFAMAIDKDSDTLYMPVDSTIVNVSIPEVKLYSDTVVLSGSVNPVPASGNINFLFHSGDKITTYPSSKPVTIQLMGSVPVGTYQVTLEAKGPNGTPVHRRTMSVKVMPGANLFVDATASPSSLCQGSSSQLDASVLGGTAPYTYVWTPSTGLSNPNVANPAATPQSSTWYKVTVSDNATHVSSDSVLVTVNTTPATPGNITGPAVVCKDSTAAYSIAPVTGATSYSWTVPADATIVTGQNTTDVTIDWGVTAGNVSVIAGNTCGNSNPGVLAVTLAEPPPTPAEIDGPDKACSGASVVFSVDPVTGATGYNWTVPADAIITGVTGTPTINVQWGNTAGDVTVAVSNACGTGLPAVKNISIETMPAAAGSISGSDTVCINHSNYSYSVPVIAEATSYLWTLPAGAVITSGEGTNSIVVSFGNEAVSGIISVNGSNTCGSGNSSTKNIVVKACTGIADKNSPSVSIYPNPATESITVSLTGMTGKADLMIMNTSGQIILTKNLNINSSEFSDQINLSGFARGVYYVKLINNNKVLVEKLILQ